jgi:hypothetical protein
MMDKDQIVKALVKGLKWEQTTSGFWRGVGQLHISYLAAVSKSENHVGEWRLGGPWDGFIYHPTLAAAQAAAEDDYRSRIAAALDLDKIAGLVEAGDKLAQTMADMLVAGDVIRNLSALGRDSLWGEVNTIRAALAAFRGDASEGGQA